MDTNTVICVMLGLPGAGKTTVTHKLGSDIHQFSNFEIKILTFSFDDFLSLEDQEKLVNLMKNNLDCKVYKDVRSKFAENIEDALTNIQMNTNKTDLDTHKYLIIVDDNFYYKSMRYRFFQMASKYNCGFCQVYLKCDIAFAIERNQNRSKCVKEEVIKKMCDKMESPSISNPWEKESISITSNDIDKEFSNICHIIIKNFSNGIPTINLSSLEKAEAQAINLKSLVHRTDLILRTLVGDRIKDCDEQAISKMEFALVANTVRQNLISRLKNKNLQIPITVLESDVINVEELTQFLKMEFDNNLNL